MKRVVLETFLQHIRLVYILKKKQQQSNQINKSVNDLEIDKYDYN